MKTRLLLAVPLLLMAIGCSTETRTFEVSVQNRTSKPISLWTVKEYGPPETAWLSPEQVAVLANPPADDQLPGQVIPPGQTAINKTPLEGKFDKIRGRAFARIYEGTPTLTQMLAIDRGSLSRLDLPLQPGFNSFIIEDDGGLITAVRKSQTSEAPTTQPTQLPR
jgi:hypothetical protein